MKKGHGYQRIKKRCLALLLTVAIASSNIDFQAFAKATETVEQADYNEEIVNGLQQLCPDGVNARDLLDQLRKRGFIDAKGMPIEGGTYIVNGKEMSEDELAAEAANHDSGTVNVDGAEVLWEEISNFIQTKQALVQIQEYAKTETEINEDNEEEYIKSLSSLSEQLKSGELKIYGDPSGSTYAAGVSHQVRAMVSPETDTIEETGTTQILKVNVALTIKQNVPVTFSYRTVSGSGSGNGSGKVSIPAGETEAQFAVTYDGNTEERNGKRVFYIQCFDIHNALFDEGESGGKSISIPIEVTKADKFEYLHVISGKTNIDCKYTSITGLDQRTVTNSISYSDISKYIDKWNDNIYTVNYNIHPTTDVDFKFLELWVGDVDYSVKTDRLTGMSTSYIDNAKYSYSEHYSGRSRKSDRVSSTISHAIGRIAIDSSAAWQFTSTVKAYHGFSYSGGITMSMRIKEVHEKVNLTGLSIPDGTFYAGQSVPIVASFDEKIRIDDTVQLTLADGSVLTPVETGTSGKSCTFLYQVPNMPSPSIPAISELSFHGTKTFSEDEAILPEQDNTVFDLAKMQWDLPDKITTKNDNCLLRSYKDVSFADIQCTIDDNSPGNQWVTEVLTIDLSEQGAYGKWIQGNTAPVSGLDLKGRKDIRSASEVQKKLEGTSYAIYADRSQYSISEYVKSMYLSVDGGTTRVPFYVISRLGETTETNEIPVALIAQYRPELNIKQEERQELNELFMDPDTKSEIDYLVVNKAAELLFSQTSRSLPVPQSYLVKNAVFSYPGAASIDYSSDNPFFSNWSELVDNPSDLVSYHLGYDKDIKHVVTSDKENPDYYDSSDSEETYSSRNRTEGSEDKVIILKEESKEGAGDAIKTAQYEIENPLITKPFYVESDELRMTARFQEDFSYVGTENLIWVSSDESIATVSYPEEFAGKNAASYGADRTAAVNIVPTGKAGTVYFTLYNLNGGITGYTPVELCRSVTLLCEAGKGPFLKISSVNGKEPVLSCRQKESLDVCFTSNLTANNASTAESTAQLQEYSALDYPTAFTMEVYETDFKGQPAGEPVYKKTECSTNSHTLGKMTIPEGILQNVYGGTDVSYAVKIYAESLSVQDDSSKMVIERELLTASAGICVCSNPPEVYLGKLKSYSILDNQDLKMSYDMKSNGATLAATSITITDSDGEEVFSDSLKEGTNAVTWKPELVTGQLKKVYIVRASVQEKDSETPSTDSYILYVYNHGALDILVEAVDGKNEKGTTDVNEITLDNHSKIQNLLGDDGKTISIDGQKISLEGLMRDINLSSMISINYGDFVWGQISDQIKWETSSDTANEDSSAVTLNYEQSGYYSNIDSTSYVSYAPCENFMSVGLKDGESKITATQARTGMSSTISITSKTVKDQLYLFKFLPELETKVEYVNGKGENCIVHSNKAGELAVYEESGIKSDVYFYSENDQGSYIGTIGNQNLVSGEKDISKLENYPVNNVRLRSISNVNLYIIDNDGNPYANQKIWLRGGVYKNSEYCYAAKFGTKKDHLNDGKEDQIFTTDSSGKITAYFDSSQFYTMEEDTIADRLVNPNDEISYSFEVKFQLDDDENPGHSIYEPQFVHINALVNTSNFANACSASIQLRDMARYAKSVKPKTPVINSQYFYQFERNTGYMGNASKVYDYKGSLGISWKYPTAVLDTEVLMWGEPVETEELIYKDKNGNEFNYGKQMKAIEEGRYQVLYKNYTEKPVASQKSQVICYPFADMPVVETLWTMEKKDFDTWMDDETYEALTCTIYDGSIEMKNMANSFTVCNQADKEPVGQVKDYFQDVLDWLCGTFCWLPKDYERNLFNKDRIVGMASSTLTSLVSDEGRPVSISLSPTVDPLCFHAVISIGVTPAYKNFTDEKSYSDTGEVIISKYEENSKEIFGDKVTYTSRSPASEEPSPSPSPSPEATDGTAEGSTENGGSYTAGYKDSSKKSKVKEFLAAKLEKPVGKMTKYIEDIPKDSKVKAEERKEKRNYLKKEGSVSLSFSGELYLEIRLNKNINKWGISVYGGGLHTGVNASYKFRKNFLLSPVPVPITCTLTVGAGASVNYQCSEVGALVEYNKTGSNINGISDIKSNRLTSVGFNLYCSGFAGLGWDFGGFEFKAGVNGKIEASETTKMLEGWERARMKQLKEYSGSGSRFSVSGSIGLTVEFAILIWEGSLELLSQSYEFNHLEKGEWDKVNSLWNDSYGGLKLSTQNYAYAMALNEEEEEDRVRNKIWKGGGNSEPEKVGANVRNMVQCNAYTFANPEYNEDGSIIAYLSDFNSKDAEDKLACFATLKNGKYVNKDAIEPVTYITDELNNETGEAGADGKLDPVNDAEGNRINRYRDTERTGYGDSTVRIAGTKDFSVATWVRQKSRFPKETGENVTKQDLTAMIHASEICASIWTGDEWSTVQLTDNTSGDINPSVAVSDNYAVVTWRSVEASNSENPLDFNVHDVVNAKIYDRKEQTWSQIYTLYNAHNGSINTVQAGIMNDGTAIAAYTVKTGEEEKDSENSEVMYTTIAKDGSIRPSVRVTNDNNTDKNVQITKINWNVGEHFILGWFKQSNSGQIDEDGNAVMINDIGLLAVDSNGIPSSDFIEDIHTSDTEEVMADFKFVKPSKDATINDLAILWSSTCENESEEITDKNVLIPSSIYTLSEIRFGENGNTITHSVSSEVARMDAGDTIDSFSAYWKGDILQTVLQSTHYEINLNDPSTYTVNEVQKETGTDEEAETEEVYTPIGRTNMYTVTSKLKLCSVETEEPYVDTNAIMGGLTIPVQFTMKNSGIQKVKKLTVNLDGKATDFNVELLPGESTVQAVYYKVPTDGIKNVDYSIVAQGAGVSSRAQDCSGKLELNHPEIAMTDLKMVKEEQKERTIQMSIKNYGNVPLENGGKTVVIQLYDQNPDSSGETDGYGDTEEAEMEAEPIETIEVKDNSELALIDASAYTCQFTLSEKQIDHLLNTKFTEEELKESNYEIPDSEVMLYVKAEVKDEYGESESNDYMYDNQGTVSIQSLAGKYESGTSISTSMEKSDNALDAIVSVKNNYYARKINGNIAAVLKDKNGKIISKVKQSYDSTKEDKGIISIQEESIGEVTIHFTEEDMLSGYTIQDVCSVTARCADADDSNLSAELSDIYVMGQPVETDLFKEYSDADNMSNQKMEVNENGAAVKRTVRVSEKSYYMNGELNKNQLNSVISAFAQNPSNDVELKLNGVTLTKGTGAQMADIKLGKGLTTLTATVFGTVYKQMKVTRKESNGKTASSKKVEYYDLNEDGKAIDVDGSELDLSAEDIVGYEKIYVQNRCKYIANLSKAENVVDSTADKKEETDKTASKRIVNLLLLKAKTTHKSKNQKYSSVLTWNAMNGADGYVVYGAKCNTAKKTYTMKPIKTIKNGRIHTFIHKGLAVNQGYKYMVKAYRLVNGKKKIIQKSYTVRVIVTGSNSKYANPIDIKLDKTSISLVSGKGTKIVAELILPKGKKLRKQGSKIRYISSAPSIATVTKDGRVKGKKKGSCYIYIFTQNGIWKKIKITVKAKKIAKK